MGAQQRRAIAKPAANQYTYESAGLLVEGVALSGLLGVLSTQAFEIGHGLTIAQT